MTLGRALLLATLAVLVGLPLALAPRGVETPPSHEATVVIFTPHNEQIRQEFGDAFAQWHHATYGTPVRVAWSTPGGTSEIRKMLEAAYASDLRRDAPVGGQGDLLFGGGSYEFTQLAKPILVETPEGVRSTTVLEPLHFSKEYLAAIYGPDRNGAPPRIGDIPLYDANGFWYGAAMSGFGIVWNRDLMSELGLAAPTQWEDLCARELDGWVALVNPAQSGSITTAYEAILQRRGWVEGWRILRRMAANARTFSASAPKAPMDVSLGDAAAGVCIDFYGRYQAQAIQSAAGERGGGDRVGYIDPAGETTIDPDPIAMLRGAPNPELARRFVEFVLSREGQSLWQFRVQQPGSSADDLGPKRYELRRMPVRRDLYRHDLHRFVDAVDPWSIATEVENPNPNFRAFLPSIFVAMALDNRHGLGEAWRAIINHPAYPHRVRSGGESVIVSADDVTDPQLKRMLEQFDALPVIAGPDGRWYQLGDPDHVQIVRDGWLRGGWKDAGLWPDDAAPAEVLRARMTKFFRDAYATLLAIAEEEPS